MTGSSIPAKLTIDVLLSGYRSGLFTPEDVIAAVIARAGHTTDKNIWILPPTDERIRPYLDRLRSLNPADHPLWGIPFAIKDNIEAAGWPITAGCPDYTYTAERHAGVVERLVAAGAIPVGKTNLDQFATGLVGTRSPYGAAHNALRPELISGGSSSGSAVAVALGQAAFSLGTDTAGSGRVPAALNGLVGYKPAVGAWPSRGVVPACRSIDCVTAFANTLDDAEAVDRPIRGRLEDDPYSFDRPLAPAALPKRFLLPADPPTFYGPFEAEYRAAWERAKAMIAQTGIPVVEIDISMLGEAAALLYEGPLVAERWSDLQPFIERHPGSTLPVTETVLRTGEQVSFTASALFRSQHRLAEIRRSADTLLHEAVLILPTAGGTWTREQVDADPIATNSRMGLYTNHCNLLDLSALAIPAGEAAQRLPFGITLFARPAEEANLGAAARLIERETNRITVAVCGLHMRGMTLEPQMIGLGASFVETVRTAPAYKLYRLPTSPPKPGLVRVHAGGSAIEMELWSMPLSSFGRFTADIPAPLGIGRIELQDGQLVSGFVCEAYAAQEDADITQHGGWRGALAAVEAAL
ncbi:MULTISPECIES: allophanate hydrolase [Saccharibacillus]|uniref:allophanate hydrolase n=1 Tax=Saccharibacillus TaxID=456492 RepID=UPI001239BCFA|nr:allophanate hydrolase [Saccharibacillus sp. WB 17]MWJ32793.1 allophanate hydrolase [Saccharibacillus sp. WB 17]